MYANEMPRLSKRAMVSALPAAPARARQTARNTLEYETAEGVRVVRLYQTDILTFPREGGFTIDTGGFGTVTTRARLNDALPDGWRVSAQSGRMHLNGTPFNTVITVTPNGEILSDAADQPDPGKQIDAYMKAWRARGLPTVAESGGDPWILREGKVEPDVMRDWVESRYVFRLLYVLALRYAGMADQGVGLYLQYADARGLDTLDYRRIRRYVRACLGGVA